MNATRTPAELLAWICGATWDLAPAPRALVVFAHPDDETVAASGVLRRLRGARFVCVTDGAPRDGRDSRDAGFDSCAAYADARRAELRAALSLAGIQTAQIRFLEIPDQEAALNLVDLTRSLAGLIRTTEVDVVVTHPYEGGHPDHDATAFAVHHACRLQRAHGESAPAIIEAACYHGKGGRMVFGEFLPARSWELVVHLDEDAAALKRRMIACHATQRNVLREARLDAERFRLAPPYCFKEPPPGDELLYERFAWGMTSDRWSRLARAAIDELADSAAAAGGLVPEKEAACR